METFNKRRMRMFRKYRHPDPRLAQVHSLDQSTIRVIQDPIRCFLNRDAQAENDTETTMWEQSSIKQTFQRVPEESTWASLSRSRMFF